MIHLYEMGMLNDINFSKSNPDDTNIPPNIYKNLSNIYHVSLYNICLIIHVLHTYDNEL